MNEGSTAVETNIGITDSDTGDSNTCTLGGADAGDFTCSVSATAYSLAFSSAPDYENPADSDTNNIYIVTVTINDGAQNGATISYTVTVNNLDDEAPVFSSSATPSVAASARRGTFFFVFFGHFFCALNSDFNGDLFIFDFENY